MAAAVLWIDSSPAATKTIGLRQIGGVTNKAVDVRMSRSMERRKENQKQQLSITMFTVLRSTWYIVLQQGTYNPHTKGRTIMKPTKANHRTQSDSTNGKRQTRRSATKNKYYLGAVLERQLPRISSPSAKAPWNTPPTLCPHRRTGPNKVFASCGDAATNKTPFQTASKMLQRPKNGRGRSANRKFTLAISNKQAAPRRTIIPPRHADTVFAVGFGSAAIKAVA